MLKISQILPFKKSGSWLETLLKNLTTILKSTGLSLIEDLGEWKLQNSDASALITQQDLETITQTLAEINEEAEADRQYKKQHEINQRELNPLIFEKD